MKRLLYVLLLLTVNHSIAQSTDTIPITWTGDHEALLLPVTLPGQPGVFYMQFDLGSPHTLFYKNAFPGMADTLHNYSFYIGQRRFTPPSMPVRKMENPGNIIGTIGSDFIANDIVVFDFPHNRLLLTSQLPGDYAVELQPYYFQAGRILLPAILQQQKTIFIYDSGSSAFSLITDSATAIQLSIQGSSGISVPVNSWGRILTAHTFPSADSITIAHQTVPLKRITWISGASAGQIQQMKQFGIGGMIGNRLFLKTVLILDAKRQLFGVIPE